MDYQEYWDNLDDFDVEGFLRQEQENEQERLEQELERVEQLLEERVQIHLEAVEELESKLDWYLERLEQAYRLSGGDQQKIRELKTKVENFYSELRTEKRQQWRDKIELEMELREVESALEEVEDQSIIDLF